MCSAMDKKAHCTAAEKKLNNTTDDNGDDWFEVELFRAMR